MSKKLEAVKELAQKRGEELEKIRTQLKEEFFGIDTQINQLIEAVRGFYTLPEVQWKHQIVCVWGATGTGKTTVIKRLIELMGLSGVSLEVDAGGLSLSTSRWEIDDQLEELASCIENGRGVFLIDEFHTVRTVSERGEEIARPGIRVLWELLDTGKVITDNRYSRAGDVMSELSVSKQRGLKIRQNKYEDPVTFGIMTDDYDRFSWPSSDEESPKEERVCKVISPHSFRKLYRAAPSLFNHIADYEYWEASLFSKWEDIQEVIDFVMSCIRKSTLMTELDFRRSLIFVVGNLDEAFYEGIGVQDPNDADRLNVTSEMLSPADIKNALRARFRTESIGRLGNTHILYPYLTIDTYRKIIRKENTRFTNKLRELGTELTIDSSVVELVRNETSSPGFGARSVLLGYEATVVAAVTEALIALDIPDSMSMLYRDGKYYFESGSGKRFELTPYLPNTEGRKALGDNTEAISAVHEAGHVLLLCMSGLSNEIVRVRCTADSVGSDSYGAVYVQRGTGQLSKRLIIDMVKVSLAGTIAEELVFGKDNILNSCGTDYAKAMSLLSDMICQCSMPIEGTPQVRRLIPTNEAALIGRSTDTVIVADKLALEILNRCDEEVRETLTVHKEALLDLARLLFERGELLKQDILDCLEKHTVPLQEPFSYVDVLKVGGTCE